MRRHSFSRIASNNWHVFLNSHHPNLDRHSRNHNIIFPFKRGDNIHKAASIIRMASSSIDQRLLGGDYAGLSATFNPQTGAFIPIPERLIPNEYIQWGQEPKCLQVLVSEDMLIKGKVDGEETTTATATIDRTTISILPAAGCGLDNHDTIKTEDSIDMTSSTTWNDASSSSVVVALDYKNSGTNSVRLETIFGISSDDTDKDGDDSFYRIRVLLDIATRRPEATASTEASSSSSTSLTSFHPKSPMTIILERRTNEVSSRGTIADGGGLDAKTIAELLGSQLSKSKSFVEQELENHQLEEEAGNSLKRSGMHRLNFPGNIRISYGPSSSIDKNDVSKGCDGGWTCQVSRVGKNDVRNGVTRTIFNSNDDDFRIETKIG